MAHDVSKPHHFWRSPHRLGWMLLQALMQTGRHADAIYILFAIVLMNMLLSPPPVVLETGGVLGLFWQLLSFALLFTLMTGWMQMLHARTWLLMVDEARRTPEAEATAEWQSPAPCPVVFAQARTVPEEGDVVPSSPTYIPPVMESTNENPLLLQALETERPVLMRPVRVPFFQGIARFWGRSVILNFLQVLLLLGTMLAPLAYLAYFKGVPETFTQGNPEALLMQLSDMSKPELTAWMSRLPRAELELISQWGAGLCLSMGLTLLVFLATALWWPLMLVWDISPLQALGLQFQLLRRDYFRAVLVGSLQFGVFGFFLMLQVTRTGITWLDAMTQVAIFLAYLYGNHLAFLYIFSATRPPFLTPQQREQLQKQHMSLNAAQPL
jgi:hypothetical protein